ncbi:Protein of unknown function (DUF3307) [Desulfosporosinus orientis DSM 765]|uniref:DUF3307 domain-containing protein n=1 Tax=Desulfosporosinus orientis (strain ATCC 19365 / DSM 765 / NCIMB 8382 / VKM B-1628 / Singapore I) TaxID=768706 RepID=G7W6R6_DESOD|nr:DUF3307 domain-containing protein [Desulfosporosinus orientis]AET69198.1 Protein of unknown function (DUF3307) [Desulfosporosinus orientis DSM 765]
MDYLIGHLVGDYLLQTEWQAVNKKTPGLKGWLACLIHCSFWTLSVSVFTGWFSVKVVLLVFLSHILLDRTNFVAWYLSVSRKGQERWLQIVCDNTMHLVLLWLINRFVV